MFLDLKEGSIHKPFKEKSCSTCHNPHASEYTAHTTSSMPGLCYECHKKMDSDVKASNNRHLPVEEGKCSSCHSPHGTRIKRLLLNRPKELCLSCHERIITTTVRKGHIEMEKGDCLSCHVAHFSESKYLITAKDPALCIKCHSTDTDALLKAHIKPIAKINHCLNCHEPHVTEKQGLLRKIKHSPFSKGDCKACHE
jgi:predicted CXXCH cytochrome family protein